MTSSHSNATNPPWTAVDKNMVDTSYICIPSIPQGKRNYEIRTSRPFSHGLFFFLKILMKCIVTYYVVYNAK